MRTSLLFYSAVVVLLVSVTACVKDSEETAQDLGVIPDGCGSDGARMQATVGGSSYCASAQLLAVGDGLSVTVTGVDLTGNTIILQADSIAVGQQAITEASNGLLLMQGGNSYVVMPGHNGMLTITAADTTAHILKASFSAVLHNDASGQSRTVEGSIDVVYDEEQ